MNRLTSPTLTLVAAAALAAAVVAPAPDAGAAPAGRAVSANKPAKNGRARKSTPRPKPRPAPGVIDAEGAPDPTSSESAGAPANTEAPVVTAAAAQGSPASSPSGHGATTSATAPAGRDATGRDGQVDSPSPATDRAAPTPTGAARVEALRAEYETLKDALFRSRARRETLESALLSTQLLPIIRWDGSRHHAVKHAELRLDGVRIWESGDALTTDKPVALAARSAPPGAHVLGVRVEIRSRDDAKLGYVSDQSFTLTLPEGKKTTVEITIDEDGDAPSYNPEIEIEVSSK